ncbi:hypothetical protein BDV96DRAFT_371743 [Lophiotrema nucula]|uniref:Uncharacterized protein n=1 Tax=Lophiotrema nucula TaxID=690887 RepID=A0A6A5ZL39_9PLEO|nr:hypothetical protein BDV96DRAFT_371743 [Lophiotrema nucula]
MISQPWFDRLLLPVHQISNSTGGFYQHLYIDNSILYIQLFRCGSLCDLPTISIRSGKFMQNETKSRKHLETRLRNRRFDIPNFDSTTWQTLCFPLKVSEPLAFAPSALPSTVATGFMGGKFIELLHSRSLKRSETNSGHAKFCPGDDHAGRCEFGVRGAYAVGLIQFVAREMLRHKQISTGRRYTSMPTTLALIHSSSNSETAVGRLIRRESLGLITVAGGFREAR